jgi:thymidylate kinase
MYPFGHMARILLFWVLRLEQCRIIQDMDGTADIIFADRFWGSTFAFDVRGHGMPGELLDWISRDIKRQPDITILFDAPFEVVRKRKKAKTMNDPDFAKRVESGYRELADALSWIRVDATQKPEKVMSDCLAIIEGRA